MGAEHHDLVLAITSHVPHLIAYNIVGTAADLETVTQSEVMKFSAGGFRDFTRIAASDPTMWRDVFLNNREAVLEMLGRFTEDLTALQRLIRYGEGDRLFDLFTRTRAIRRGIIAAGQETAGRRLRPPARQGRARRSRPSAAHRQRSVGLGRDACRPARMRPTAIEPTAVRRKMTSVRSSARAGPSGVSTGTVSAIDHAEDLVGILGRARLDRLGERDEGVAGWRRRTVSVPERRPFGAIVRCTVGVGDGVAGGEAQAVDMGRAAGPGPGAERRARIGAERRRRNRAR